jgi:hypothetical protein
MNDDFLHRIRVQPPLDFVARLGTRLQLPSTTSRLPPRLRLLRAWPGLVLLGAAALAAASPAVRTIVTHVWNVLFTANSDALLSQAPQPSAATRAGGASESTRPVDAVAQPARPSTNRTAPESPGGNTPVSASPAEGTFRGFVPAVPAFAELLRVGDGCRNQQSGLRCMQWDGYDLIAEISNEPRSEEDSWPQAMERKLKDFLDASKTAPVVVEQIHCGSGGCLIDFTLEKGDLTFQQAESVYTALLARLTDEASFASDFVAPSDEPNNDTGDAGFWGPDSNPKSEKLWVWQRRRTD